MPAPRIHCFTTAENAGTTITLALPNSGSSAGPDGAKDAVPGDYLVVVVGNDDTTTTDQYDATSDPAGWTFVNEAGDGTSDAHVGAFFKKLTEADIAAGSFDFTSLVTGDQWGIAILINGVEQDEASVLNATGADVIDGTPPIAITGVTTNVADCLALAAACYDGGDDGGFATSGTGWTELAEHRSATGIGNSAGSVSYNKMSGTGASGTCTVSPTVSDGMAGFQFALEPGPSAIGGSADLAFSATATLEAALVLDGVDSVGPSRLEFADIVYPQDEFLLVEVEQGAIEGSADLVFGQAAALTGDGALSGAGALAFADAAALTGIGALAGTIDFSFAGSGSLAGVSDLIGLAEITFGETAVLIGDGALAGAGAIVFGESAALTGDGALVGASALAFANQGTLSGGGQISGSADIAFAGSGTLAGPGEISGSADIAFAGSGVLQGDGALAGAGAITFGDAATLTADGALLGAAAVVFANSGTLSEPGSALDGVDSVGPSRLEPREIQYPPDEYFEFGDPTLAGVAAIAFSLTGELDQPPFPAELIDSIQAEDTAEVWDPNITSAGIAVSTAPSVLVGSSDVVFSAAAVLVGTGALAGASAVTFAGSATLAGTGALGGSSDAAFSLSGSLAGAGEAIGEASLLFDGSAALDGSGALAGVGAITFADAATLTADGALAGTAALAFALSGALGGPGDTSGTSDLVFAGVAALTGSGALAGSASVTFSETAVLVGTGAIAGVAAVEFSAQGALGATGALQGAAGITFGSAAVLESAGMAGVAAIAFTASATLTATGALAGVASMAFFAVVDNAIPQAAAGYRRGGAAVRVLHWIYRSFDELVLETGGPLVAERAGSTQPAAVSASFSVMDEAEPVAARGVWRAAIRASAPFEVIEGGSPRARRGLPSRAVVQWFLENVA